MLKLQRGGYNDINVSRRVGRVLRRIKENNLPFLDNLLGELLRPAQAEELPSFDSGALIGVEKVGEQWQIFRQLGPRMIY